MVLIAIMWDRNKQITAFSSIASMFKQAAKEIYIEMHRTCHECTIETNCMVYESTGLTIGVCTYDVVFNMCTCTP